MPDRAPHRDTRFPWWPVSMTVLLAGTLYASLSARRWTADREDRIRLESYAQGQRDAALTILTDAGVRDSLLTGEACR